MAKVHPKRLMFSSCSEYTSSQREVFTVWMKSLVINGNGCTVFNSQGELVFRVDNYQTRSSTEVLLMNIYGDVLFSITRKKGLFFRSWEGHRWVNSRLDTEGEWFNVKRKLRLFGRGRTDCRVVVGYSKVRTEYKILGLRRRSSLRIVDCQGGALAEAMQKQSLGGVSLGVSLGSDVLSLMVEPQIDQSLVMALVIAYAMLNNKF